jgi:hypothetical protein
MKYLVSSRIPVGRILRILTQQMQHGMAYFSWGLTMWKVTNPVQQDARVPVEKIPLLTFGRRRQITVV